MPHRMTSSKFGHTSNMFFFFVCASIFSRYAEHRDGCQEIEVIFFSFVTSIIFSTFFCQSLKYEIFALGCFIILTSSGILRCSMAEMKPTFFLPVNGLYENHPPMPSACPGHIFVVGFSLAYAIIISVPAR